MRRNIFIGSRPSSRRRRRIFCVGETRGVDDAHIFKALVEHRIRRGARTGRCSRERCQRRLRELRRHPHPPRSSTTAFSRKRPPGPSRRTNPSRDFNRCSNSACASSIPDPSTSTGWPASTGVSHPRMTPAEGGPSYVTRNPCGVSNAVGITNGRCKFSRRVRTKRRVVALRPGHATLYVVVRATQKAPRAARSSSPASPGKPSPPSHRSF